MPELTNDDFIENLINDPLYDVRSDGTIWSIAYGSNGSGVSDKQVWRQLSGRKRSDGYLRITYYGYGKYRDLRVNRVIYRKFIGPLNPNLVIHHKDDDPTNNHPSNLEQITQGDNVRKGTSKLTWEVVNEIRSKYKKPLKDAYSIAKHYGISERSLYNILSGERW